LAAYVVAFGFLMGCGAESPPVDELAGIRAALPAEVAGWRVGEGEVYDTESIYSYIDGHAEVFLAYGMKRCFAVRYAAPEGEPDIVLDLYEQASPADAFGVFSVDRDGDVADVGQAAVLRPGWLSFWKGHWYGSVYAEGESDAARDALLALGRAAADAIHDAGEQPPLVGELPIDGLEETSVRFLHAQEILNGVVYLGFDNVFGLDPETDAVIGRYERAAGSGWLLLVDYSNESDASRAAERSREAGLAVVHDGTRLAAAIEPAPEDFGKVLLADVMGGTDE
jgi:hypothetical protein